MSPDERSARIERGREAMLARHLRELAELRERHTTEKADIEVLVRTAWSSGDDSLSRATAWLQVVQRRPAVRERHKREVQALRSEHREQRRKLRIVR